MYACKGQTEPHGAAVQKATKRGKTWIITGSSYKNVGDVMTRLVTCLRPTGSKKRRQANAEKTLKKKKTKKEDSDTVRNWIAKPEKAGRAANGHPACVSDMGVANLCVRFEPTIKWHRIALEGPTLASIF